MTKDWPYCPDCGREARMTCKEPVFECRNPHCKVLRIIVDVETWRIVRVERGEKPPPSQEEVTDDDVDWDAVPEPFDWPSLFKT